MDVLSVILRVPGIAKRRQQSEPQSDDDLYDVLDESERTEHLDMRQPYTVSAVETQTDESSKPRNLFTTIRQKLLALVGR